MIENTHSPSLLSAYHDIVASSSVAKLTCDCTENVKVVSWDKFLTQSVEAATNKEWNFAIYVTCLIFYSDQKVWPQLANLTRLHAERKTHV